MNNTRGFARPRIGIITLSVLVALFLLAMTNRTFWGKIHIYLANYPAAIWTLYLALGFLFLAVILLFSFKFIAKPIFALLILAAAIGSWFTDTFGVIIDSDMVRNAFQTTPAEAQHLMTTGFIIHMLLFAALPISLLLWVRVEYRSPLRTVTQHGMVIIAALGIVICSAFMFSKPYVTAIRQHKDIVKSLNPVSPLAGTIKFVIQETADAHMVVQPLGTDAKIVRPTPETGKPRVTIVVAGETARASNFSLGGYEKLTNPELAKRDIIYFPNTTSCGTATATSIPCMFSQFTRPQYSHRKGLANENLMDVLAHSGLRVEWWENNTGSKGVADRIPLTNVGQNSDPRFCIRGECRDDILLERLDAWLDTVTADSVLVLHTMGSHGPTYHLRYPENFNHFKPACETAELGHCTDAEIVNAYDNTILFTDHVLSTIIDKLQARSSALETSMIYMSDHGESLGENGIYLHGLPYMLAPTSQTHIPFVLWLDPSFAQTMKLDPSCLRLKAKQDYSHDNLFHSVLSMMNVQTQAYDPQLDIFASCKTEKVS